MTRSKLTQGKANRVHSELPSEAKTIRLGTEALRDLLKCPRVTGHVQGLSTGEALGELADPADWGDSSCSKQCCAESFALLLSLLHPPLSSSSLQHLYSEGKWHSTVSLI